jgi:hypothetical protein
VLQQHAAVELGGMLVRATLRSLPKAERMRCIAALRATGSAIATVRRYEEGEQWDLNVDQCMPPINVRLQRKCNSLVRTSHRVAH